jgi:RimJ/RimL family protein N-acetyltransferase
MADAAAAVSDGRGLHRVAAALDPERAGDGSAVTLRPAAREDSDLVFAWQTEPQARRYARNPRPPSREEHERWLAGVLSDPARLLNVVEVDGEPVGTVRLDLRDVEPESWEISILIAAAQRSRGVGAAALEAARRLVPQGTLLAEIDPANIASRQAFARVGYRAVDATWFRLDPSRSPMAAGRKTELRA